jgi:hypothetical protein
VHDEHLDMLVRIVEAADSLGVAIEVTLFSHEKQPDLSAPFPQPDPSDLERRRDQRVTTL